MRVSSIGYNHSSSSKFNKINNNTHSPAFKAFRFEDLQKIEESGTNTKLLGKVLNSILNRPLKTFTDGIYVLSNSDHHYTAVNLKGILENYRLGAFRGDIKLIQDERVRFPIFIRRLLDADNHYRALELDGYDADVLSKNNKSQSLGFFSIACAKEGDKLKINNLDPITLNKKIDMDNLGSYIYHNTLREYLLLNNVEPAHRW